MMTQVALVGLILLFISGCAFLPAPLTYFNYARTGYDVTQIAEGEATTADSILSATTDMDCRILNVIDSKDICTERFEE